MKHLTIVLLLIISVGSYSQTMSCEKFKSGKFTILEDSTGTSVVERTGGTQIEYGGPFAVKAKFDVTWINDCTYTLKLNEILENPNNVKFPEGMILTVEIIETKEDSYVQNISSNYTDFQMKAELVRIE